MVNIFRKHKIFATVTLCLESLVQKHYIENKKIISLEGNLLRLAMSDKISRRVYKILYKQQSQFRKLLSIKLNMEKLFQ